MLIRSQDKTFLLNFNNLTAIYMEKIDKDFSIVYNDFEDAYTLGKYSTEAKAIKVLDMIQEDDKNALRQDMLVRAAMKVIEDNAVIKEA